MIVTAATTITMIATRTTIGQTLVPVKAQNLSTRPKAPMKVEITPKKIKAKTIDRVVITKQEIVLISLNLKRKDRARAAKTTRNSNLVRKLAVRTSKNLSTSISVATGRFQNKRKKRKKILMSKKKQKKPQKNRPQPLLSSQVSLKSNSGLTLKN